MSTCSCEDAFDDSLIIAIKEQLEQLQQAKTAKQRCNRAHNGASPRNAAGTQSTSLAKHIAQYRSILEIVEAQIRELEQEQEEQEQEEQEQEEQEQEEQEQEEQEQEEQEQEEQEQEEQEQEEQEQEEQEQEEQEQEEPEPLVETSQRRGKESQSVDSARPSLRFLCASSQLGEHMVATIQEARQNLSTKDVDERGYLILVSQNHRIDSEFTELLHNAKSPRRDEVKGFILTQGAPHCLHARVATDTLPSFRELDAFSKAPVRHFPRTDFQEWTANCPDRVRYVICEPLSDHPINGLLNAGSQCNRRPLIPGVNRPYWYVSWEPNTPATLHVEDGNAGSANLLLAGAEKHWIIIPRSSANKLEHCIRAEFPNSKQCSQFVRHHNLVVGPAWLEDREIDYEIVCQKPGEVLVTLPGRVYHEVRNTGVNFAVAINYEFTDAPDDPADYVWCEPGARRCGQNVLTRESFMPTLLDTDRCTVDVACAQAKKRPRQDLHGNGKKRKCTASSISSTRQGKVEKRTSRLDCAPAAAPALEERLVYVILSPEALCNCVSLISAWRSQLTRIELAPELEDTVARLAASDKRVCLAQHRTQLDTLLARLAQYDMASILDTQRDGAIRLDGKVYDQVLKAQGLETITAKDRNKLKERAKRAKKLFQICGDFGRGLLCLLPFNEASETQIYTMNLDSITRFHYLAATKQAEIAKRCEIGMSILDMFASDVEFAFENEELGVFNRAPQERKIALLQPVSYSKTNTYTLDDSWPKPSSWLWQWPMDPTWAPLDACETCSLEECSCFADLPQDRHRIAEYPGNRRGIQARGVSHGGLAFRKGEYIQELVGEVKSLAADKCGTIDFERPDVGLTCRLYCSEKSNWARLISHACDPCAERIVKITRGRARMMLRARRDIWDGTEITVDHRRDFSTDAECQCATCSNSRVSTPDER